jgi:hypothetical protein
LLRADGTVSGHRKRLAAVADVNAISTAIEPRYCRSMDERPPLTLRTLARLGPPHRASPELEAALNCTRHLHRAAACAHHGCEEVARDTYWPRQPARALKTAP